LVEPLKVYTSLGAGSWRFSLLRQTIQYIVPPPLGLAYTRQAELAALHGFVETFMGKVTITISVAIAPGPRESELTH